MTPAGTARPPAQDPTLSLYHLLDPEVLANPYPLYHRLRTEDPVHWDPYLHAWIVTRYADVVQVLHRFVADRTPTPAQLDAIGLSELGPVAQVMVRQMLFARWRWQRGQMATAVSAWWPTSFPVRPAARATHDPVALRDTAGLAAHVEWKNRSPAAACARSPERCAVWRARRSARCGRGSADRALGRAARHPPDRRHRRLLRPRWP